MTPGVPAEAGGYGSVNHAPLSPHGSSLTAVAPGFLSTPGPTAGGNLTALSGFILLGFSDTPELQTPLFTLFLALYVLSALGNLLMILLIQSDAQLHTPMYSFLTHLALLDLCLSSAVVPKALQTLLLGGSRVSFWGCFAQLYLFLSLAACECFLLGVMALDRYVAVCRPLLYSSAVTGTRCRGAMLLLSITGFLTPLAHTVLAARLSFCQARSIDHFFCELPTVLRLSCSDTRLHTAFQAANAGVVTLSSFLLILGSYVAIVRTVLRVPTARGRLKALSTCSSHLAAIIIFYIPGFFTYLQPPGGGGGSQGWVKGVAVCYSVLIPALNPLVYSLRNQEVKAALKRLWLRKRRPRLLGKGSSSSWALRRR